MRLQPMFAHVHERYVPAPSVDAADADTARGEVESRFAAHATAGGQIFVAADTTSGARVDQYNVGRLQLVTDALKLYGHFSGRDDMTVRHFAEVELDTGTKEPVERYFVDTHHSFAVDRRRLEMDRSIHMGAIMRRHRHNFESPTLTAWQVFLL